MNNIMSSGGLLGTGSGAYGNRNPFRGFWNTPDDTLITGMSDPFQSRVNTMWNRWAPEGTAMPDTFGAWETAMRGYMPAYGIGLGGVAGRPRSTGFGPGPRPGVGNGIGSGGGTSGGGTGTPAPNQMTWAFPQYSQTWAFTPPPAPPLTMPPIFKKPTDSGGNDRNKKNGTRPGFGLRV